MQFPFSDAQARVDATYKEFGECNQRYLSPLASVSSLRSDFPPDYMHAVCLGVCKKLLACYMYGSKYWKLNCKLSVGIKEQINNKINMYRKYMPSDFHRKMRSLHYFEQYKATEFRQFLLYLGPVVLKNKINYEYYNNFLSLHFGIYCLAQDVCIESFCSNLNALFI